MVMSTGSVASMFRPPFCLVSFSSFLLGPRKDFLIVSHRRHTLYPLQRLVLFSFALLPTFTPLSHVLSLPHVLISFISAFLHTDFNIS